MKKWEYSNEDREKRVNTIIKYLWLLVLVALVCDIVYTMFCLHNMSRDIENIKQIIMKLGI